MKSVPPKGSKNSIAGASSASPLSLGAGPAEASSPLEINVRAGDSIHTHAPSNETFAAGSPSGSPESAITPHQTFEALDRTGNGPSASWVHTSSQRAEAGFQDPVLGWIAVRADQGGGGVHATVVPSTAEAAESLGSQMAGLTAHLAESHAQVASLSLGTSDHGNTSTAAGQSFNQSAGRERPQGKPRHSATDSATSDSDVFNFTFPRSNLPDFVGRTSGL